jgi:hypothetical protein
MAKVVTMETFKCQPHSIETIYRFGDIQNASSCFEFLAEKVDESIKKSKINKDLKSFSMILFDEVKNAASAYHRTF